VGGIEINVIEYLRANLRDRYKDCYAVLKELLQNADDAGASELHIAAIDRLDDASHSLLAGPLLIVANNARFSFRDSCAIHQAGMGSKGLEENQIGKFGLGLKSVFHLCEAFFYVSDRRGDNEQVGEQLKKYGRTGILNPWKGARYPDWEDFATKDRERLRAVALALLGNAQEDWFAICLPLRKQLHCQEHSGEDPARWAIEPRYFGDEQQPPSDVFSRAHYDSICRMLPLMTSLDRVSFWQFSASPDRIPKPLAEVVRRSSQRVNWRTMPVGIEAMAGTVEVRFEGESKLRNYVGIQERLNRRDLVDMATRGDWPWMDAQTDTGRERNPANVKQHAAVVLLEKPGDGVLRVDRAVFLPLGEPQHTGRHGAGPQNFEMLLHGYFFVDAGRLWVDFAVEQEKETARQAWNRILYLHGTLPLVISTLNRYGQTLVDQPLADLKLRTVTTLLKDSPLWEEYSDQICQERNWGFRLLFDGGRWCSTDASLSLVVLPGYEGIEPNLPFEVFPSLNARADECFLSFSHLPSLTHSRSPSWSYECVQQMLQSVPTASVVTNDAQLQYLYDVCNDLCHRRNATIQSDLQVLLRRILRDSSLSNLRKRKETLTALVRLVPASMKVPVPFKSDIVRESERLYELLINQPTDVLPVPDIFCDTDDMCSRETDTRDVRTLLTAVSGLRPNGAQEDAFHSLVSQAIAAILSVWKRGKEGFGDAFGDLRLFYVRNYGDNRRHAYTAQELGTFCELHLLFARNPSLCNKLQDCLQEEQILFVAEKEMSDLLAEAIGTISPCDISGCAALLELRPALNVNIAPRRSLLTAMLPGLDEGSKPELKEVLRYLLHGNPKASAADTDLFVGDDNAWSAAARWALTTSDDSWRMISPDLTDLKPSQADRLRLRQCDATTVPALFKNVKRESLDRQTFADRPDWREQILREWPDNGKELLKQLPLFVRTDRALTSITDQTFIQGNVPPQLATIFPNYILITDDSRIVENRRLAPTLAVEDVLRTILAKEDCRRHWQFILESLPETDSPALKKDLQTAAWIPGPQGEGIAPRCIVSRDGLREYVRQLRATGGALIHALDLTENLRKHPRWLKIESLGPRGDELPRLLGESIAGVAGYAAGLGTIPEDDLFGFMRVFAEPAGLAVMPIAGLLNALMDGTKEVPQAISKHILPAVRVPLDADRTRDVLQYLAIRHKQSAGQDRQLLLETFNRFLKEGFEQPEFVTRLKELRFLNQEGRWCSLGNLAASGDNIAPVSLIHRSHLQEFINAGFWSSNAGPQNSGEHESAMDGSSFDPKALATSAKLLDKYLRTWRNDEVPDDALAAVVAMLGNCDGFPELYEGFRDARSLEAMRNNFSWDVVGSDGLKKRMDKHHFCILPADAKFVRACNLLGNEFEAAVDKRLTSLFDGFGDKTYLRYFPMPGDGRCFQIWLRQIPPDELSREDKLKILSNTVQAIRSGIYREGDEDFLTAWRRITQVGQLDIEIAQEMILESSAMLLESQLSVRQSDKLKQIFAKWHRVRQRAKTAGQTENRSEKIAADREKVEVLEELRSLLVQDATTQQLLVSEIRKKLEANSYQASSIPFELFQNGDDAVGELEWLCGNDEPLLERVRPADLRRRFLIEVQLTDGHAVLRFAHWGRGINQFRVGATDGRDQGFDRDMERMLVLQGSGKDESIGAAPRTGKFGLGFKSVFFVCDEPRVLSASRSRFRVTAGVYPERLDAGDERRLEEVLEYVGDASHKGTVVELSLRETAGIEQAVSRFQELAGYLVVFSRRLRHCNLYQTGCPGVIYDWHPRKILPGIECGDMRSQSGKIQRALVFRLGTDGYGSVLVPIGPTGVDVDASGAIPKIWVTTPTEHAGEGPLLVNGDFDVNPGRTQLRQTDRNRGLARQMGQEFGELLCRLYVASQQDWEILRQIVGCVNASRHDFWSSLWTACLPYADPSSEFPVLPQLLFGSEHCGIYRLAREAEVIPTGLGGQHEVLTSLKKIRWRTHGALAETEIWAAAVETSWVQKTVRPSTVISHSVAQSLDRFCSVEATRLTLTTILRETMHDSPCVTPAAANDMGRLMFPKLLREITANRATASEEQDIREVLAWTRFQTAAGDWSDAESLLIGHEPATRQEEYRRAAFAPMERLLAEQYRGDGLEFFLACRKEMQASADQMSLWLLNAADVKQRKAGLEYLERGELSFALRQRLTEDKAALDGSWLANRSVREEVMSGMDADRQAVVLGMLRKADEIIPVALSPAADATRPTAEIFRDIRTWWRKHRTAILADHDRAIYPAGQLPQLSFVASREQLESDLSVRKQWLTVFMLGSMHRIGRTTRHQNRGFLDLCEQRGWLDVLAARTDDPTEWFRVMDEYLDSLQDEAKYYHWMNQFLGYYQLSRWLPIYARVFEAVTRPGVNLSDLRSIRDLADLRTSHVFSRSTGFDAPPCSRTMGLGSHFVLREVIRARAAQTDRRFAAPHELARLAFVPSAAVRRLLAQITRKSDLLNPALAKEQAAGRIADVLSEYLGDDAVFEQNYDIPLLVLTWKRFAEARRDILGIDEGQVEDDPMGFLYDDAGSEEEEA
jgi:hypothetical protein